MKYTDNLGLKKPESTDFYNVDDFNDNMDKIEEELEKRPTDDGDASSMTIEFTEALETATLTSGEKLSVAFGKIARAIRGYMSHILIKGSSSQSGHVKLTDSSAVTDTTGLALAATEKNASIGGTLAYEIAILKNNRSYVGMIIYSVTLDTEEKVKEIYGGITWSKIEGVFLLGQSSTYKINDTGGEATHTLSTAEMPSHGHSYSGTTGNESAGHTHTFSATTGTVSSDHTHSGTTDFAGVHTHNVCIRRDNTSSGSTDRIGNKSNYAEVQTTPILPAGDHFHNVSTHGISANHTHGVSGTTSDRSLNHTHSFSGNTGNTGSGSAHNNMPPYLVVYMWQRVA